MKLLDRIFQAPELVAAPPVPSWYRREWFRENFSRYFNLWLEEQSEENRVLFVGEVRGAAGRFSR